jgi:hypothetical protein
MIKNFKGFLNESTDQDMKVVDLFSSLGRNYESKKNFYTDLLQFIVDEERRDWGDIRSKAKLEETKSDKGYYKLKFSMDGKKYLLEIDFNLSYKGIKEKDAPETASDSELNRLNVILENIDIEKISIESSILNYNSSSPSDSVKKACEKFMVKMLQIDYDTLGNEIYNLEQK